MAANEVVWYHSGETGAPTLNNAAGALINVLRACLVSGFRVQSVTSITVASGVATATLSGHGYMDGSMLDISGATGSYTALNTRKKVTVTGSGSFTFPAVGLPDGAVTGTLLAKRSPLGWAEVNASNVSIFSRTASGAAAQALRIDDTAAGLASTTYARALMVESFTDTATYTGAAPTATQLSGGQYWYKGANSATAKSWVLIGDARSFYLLTDCAEALAASNGGALYAQLFAEVGAYRAGDAYRSVLGGPGAAAGSNINFALAPYRPGNSGNSPSLVLSRRAHGLGGAVIAGWTAQASTSSANVPGGSSGPLFPSTVDNGFVLQYPTMISEAAPGGAAAGNVRGVMPGVANPLADMSVDTAGLHLSVFTGVSGSDRSFLAVALGTGGSALTNNRGVVLFDITGPWQ